MRQPLRWIGVLRRLTAASVAMLATSLAACGDDGGSGPDDDGNGGEAPVVALVTEAPQPTRLLLRDGMLYWREASDEPIARMPVGGGARSAVVTTVPIPEAAISGGVTTWWIGGGRLHRIEVTGAAPEVLDEGVRDFNVPDVLALDDTHVYWVVAAPQNPCSPACRMTVRRVPRGGGPAADVVTTDTRRIADIEVFQGTLFWIEEDVGPASADGAVGSQLRSRSVLGGPITTHVDGRLNGRIPAPSPGFTPASWRPNGGLAADETHIYFGIPGFEKYEILRVLRIGGITSVVSEQATGQHNVVRDIVLSGTKVHWIDASALREAPKTGGSPVLVAPAVAEPVDLDRVGGQLFWLESDCCAHGQQGTIRRITLGGEAPSVVKAGIDAPIAISADADRVTWVEGGPVGMTEGFGRVAHVLHDGSGQMNIVEAASDGPYDVAGGFAYFANAFTIKRVPVTGGRAERLRIESFSVADVASDGTNVYWLQDGPFTLVRSQAANATGPARTHATGAGPAGIIRLDATHIYWSEASDSVRRVSKGGVDATTVWSELGGLTDFVVTGGRVYIAGWDDPTIRSVPAAGGAPVILAQPHVDQTRRLATDGALLYWIDQLAIERIGIDGQGRLALPVALETSPFHVPGIAVGETSVFWSEPAADVIRKATPK